MGNTFGCCLVEEEECYSSLLIEAPKAVKACRNFERHPLLWGCTTEEEESTEIARVLQSIKHRHGREGLHTAGFEYRLEACSLHHPPADNEDACDIVEEKKFALQEEEDITERERCEKCCTRLHHTASNTRIEDTNRSLFIVDGDMYDEICRLCQEVAQEFMQKEANLKWITLCEDDAHDVPLRALVHRDYRKEEEAKSQQPTLLIATGNGKVCAGIFSRKHLLTSGMEPSTALPMLREAKKRGMRSALITPNARGKYYTMNTFQKSLSALFTSSSIIQQQPRKQNPIYVVAHSASGGYLTRHLLTSPHLLPRIQAIAFTDSTHNIQWTKHNPTLQSKLQDSSSLYLRSNDVRSLGGKEPPKQTGSKADTDSFWRHRFGSIRTLWAGTNDHSLMHWSAHDVIWGHFDRHCASSSRCKHQ